MERHGPDYLGPGGRIVPFIFIPVNMSGFKNKLNAFQNLFKILSGIR